MLTDIVLASGLGQGVPHELFEQRLDLLHVFLGDLEGPVDNDARHDGWEWCLVGEFGIGMEDVGVRC
jgi:hypothetical protein